MSRRSPLNERYKKESAPKGSTRKSAASARAKRPSGENDSAPVKKKTTAKQKYDSAVPNTPEFKGLRKTWWITLGIATLMLVVSLLLSLEKAIDMFGTTAQYVSAALSTGAFIFIAYAWWLDLRKIRPMLKAYQASKSGKDSKNNKSKSDK